MCIRDRGNDLVGRNALRDEMGNPVGHNAGFSAAGACKHEQRALDVGCRLPLARVE